MRTALITGVSGQDGGYLTEWLLAKDYRVVGISRRSVTNSTNAFAHPQFQSLECDLVDVQGLQQIVREVRPDEIYNLGAQSRPGESWTRSLYTGEVTAMGAHRLFELALRECPKTRIYHASSSEMFGRPVSSPQDEATPFNPVNPYAVAKTYAHEMARIYRDNFGLFIATGILFNHESPRRGINFISQKIAYGAACIRRGIDTSPLLNEVGQPIVKQGRLSLGDISVQRDWGFAGDYVRAMWMMLQHDDPEDFVIGTGTLHTVQNICEVAFSTVGLDWRDFVEFDARLLRPSETGPTVANWTKARDQLGWTPEVSFTEMIRSMVEFQMESNIGT